MLQEPWGDKKPMQIMSLVGVMGQRLPLPRDPPHPDCPPAYLATIADCWAADPPARPGFAAIVRRCASPALRVACPWSIAINKPCVPYLKDNQSNSTKGRPTFCNSIH